MLWHSSEKALPPRGRPAAHPVTVNSSDKTIGPSPRMGAFGIGTAGQLGAVWCGPPEPVW